MIDWGRVDALRSEIGADDFAEVVVLFLDETDEVIARLPSCTSAKALEAALHFLKGSALNLGFADLAQLCQDGERRAAAGDATVDTGPVIASYGASKTTFARGLDPPADHRAA